MSALLSPEQLAAVRRALRYTTRSASADTVQTVAEFVDQARRTEPESSGWRGAVEVLIEQTGPVLRRLLDAEAEVERLAGELGDWSEAARERWIEKQLAETGIRAMDFRNGAEMEIEPARELLAYQVAAARAMLGDAENYTETKLSWDVKVAESPEMYTIVIQRHAPGALTPHEARQRAEARVSELEAEVERLRAEAGLVAEYRVPTADGRWLAVRREPKGDRWAIYASHRVNGDRQTWTGDMWISILMATNSELWNYPSADAALAEATRLAEAGERS